MNEAVNPINISELGQAVAREINQRELAANRTNEDMVMRFYEFDRNRSMENNSDRPTNIINIATLPRAEYDARRDPILVRMTEPVPNNIEIKTAITSSERPDNDPANRNLETNL